MNAKKLSRIRRAARARRKIKELGMPRLSVHRTPQHIYAQLIAPDGARVVVSASTVEKEIQAKCEKLAKIPSAAVVGKEIAKRILAAGVNKIAFDRSGFRYHGRVKALAEAAREGGLEF